jgi:DNA ligase (NAD+)
MYSLNNGFDVEDISRFLKQVRSFLDLPKDTKLQVMFEPKIDGLSLALTYEKGYLVQALTRGDGVIGEDVISNAKLIPDIPTEISCKMDLLEVRGEVYLSNSNFKVLNLEQEKTGRKIFSNPRNAASGTIRQFKTDVERNKKLSFFAYSVGISSSNVAATQSELLAKLKNFGFKVNSLSKVFNNPSKMFQYYDEVFLDRSCLNYDIDGIVYKINELNLQERLGYRSSSPRWAIAHKFPSELAMTQILKIEIQIGRTGAISPVAKLTPVNVGGVIVSSSTLHNKDFINGFNNKGEVIRNGVDIRVGDYVSVYRAGEVIPKIESVDLTRRQKVSTPYVFPTSCPSCNGTLIAEKTDSTIRCVNSQECSAQLIAQLKHFASKKVLNIEGLGEKIIEDLFVKQLVKEPADFYDLKSKIMSQNKTEEYLGKGWGKKSVQNLIDSIESRRTVKLDKFIFSLGIRYVGETVSLSLAKFYESWEDFERAILETERQGIEISSLNKIEGIGKLIINSLLVYFKNEKFLKKTHKLTKVLTIEDVTSTLDYNTEITNRKIVFTGTFKKISRAEMKEIVEKQGAKVLTSLSSVADILVVGEKPGSKLNKAVSLGIKIINESEFLSITAKKNSVL